MRIMKGVAHVRGRKKSEISCLTVKKMKKDNVGGDSVVERLMEESGDSCTGRYMETGDLQIE